MGEKGHHLIMLSRAKLGVVLFFTVHVQLIDGLSFGSARNIITSTSKYDEDFNRIRGPTGNKAVGIPGPSIESAVDDANERQLEVMRDWTGGGVDRRTFFISVVCAASILGVAADDADAATETNPSQEPMNHEPASSVDISMTTSLVNSESSVAVVAAIDTNAIIKRAANKAMGGGKAGAAAAVVQVFSLMWLRTAMNYQYRFGEQNV
jgi:hypothetical protein